MSLTHNLCSLAMTGVNKNSTPFWAGWAKFRELNYEAYGPGNPSIPKPQPWRPKGCTRKGILYEFPKVDEEPPAEVEKLTEPEDLEITVGGKEKYKMCAICRRPPLEILTLDCGHNFCRRCIASMRGQLMQDFASSVKDYRATLKCPLRFCHTHIPCLPIINGDFRFHLVRPEDKVETPIPIAVCEQLAMKHFKVTVDIDFTKKTRPDLFEGFEDVP
ncbi:unnamed protein product [Lymnaea stagnalis]|uniref:RING-type domain-containing protein n=1 Tax=Lymnaea stagnalis TaxID=6523 RepID=A0AAV2I3Z5_LYMST